MKMKIYWLVAMHSKPIYLFQMINFPIPMLIQCLHLLINKLKVQTLIMRDIYNKNVLMNLNVIIVQKKNIETR